MLKYILLAFVIFSIVFALSTALGVWIMVAGWGLSVKSWSVIIIGAVAQVIFAMANISLGKYLGNLAVKGMMQDMKDKLAEAVKKVQDDKKNEA